MYLVHELEAWSVPGKLLDAEYAKVVLQPEFWNAGIPNNVFLGLSSIPNEVDCRNLKRAIDSQKYSLADFEAFCLEYSLVKSIDNKDACSRYLEFMEGRCLAWIHMPPEKEHTLLPIIEKLLSARGHIVVAV